jgi:LysM repeat protein
MPRSERQHSLRYFNLAQARPARLKKPRPIYAKSPRVGKWPPLIFLIGALLITLAALSHASPPMSRGARPLALGNAYTAVAGDSYGLYYNPAGLTEVNQKEVVFDYGRSDSERESARSEFNSIYTFPYRFRDKFYPVACGVYAERAAPGANIVDLTAGTGSDAPVDEWTKGFIKFPVRLGGAVTIRRENGFKHSDRVGKAGLGIGLTGGAYAPLFRTLQVGASIRNLYLGDSNPDGASIVVGATHLHKEYLNMFADLEYGRGGVWRFHPGLEWLLARGVLRPRLGWGSRDNGGVDSVATGVGFNISPMQIDLTYLIPVKTLNDDTEQFRASLIYRFGRPQFSEIYYDRALEAASQLDQKVLGLTVEEAQLKSSLSELEQKRRLAREELDNIKSRIETLKTQDVLGQKNATIQQLKERVANLELALAGQRNQVRQLTTQKESIRTHTVVAGDTLQSLAKQYYGDANQWKKIYNANSDKIERGLPRVGARLVIP